MKYTLSAKGSAPPSLTIFTFSLSWHINVNGSHRLRQGRGGRQPHSRLCLMDVRNPLAPVVMSVPLFVPVSRQVSVCGSVNDRKGIFLFRPKPRGHWKTIFLLTHTVSWKHFRLKYGQNKLFWLSAVITEKCRLSAFGSFTRLSAVWLHRRHASFPHHTVTQRRTMSFSDT